MKAFICTFALLCTGANATPITYFEQATGSGTLGPIDFSNALVTITLSGDTSFINSLGDGVFVNLGAATVMVAGIGSGTFLDQMEAFSNQNLGFGGIADSTNRNIVVLATVSSAFDTYALATPTGPLSGSPSFGPKLTVPTSSGTFQFSAAVGNSVFSATSVPEPGTTALFGVGIACLFALRCLVRKTPHG